jgi:hypothetical protein
MNKHHEVVEELQSHRTLPGTTACRKTEQEVW